MFSPLKLGNHQLKNRFVMASMTRNQCPYSLPDETVVEYYAQRSSSAGLILSEGVLIEPQGTEWPAAPGIWSDAHVAAWKKVTDAVHAKGSKIIAQLWHLGRVCHPLHQCGQPAVAPSAIAAQGGSFRYLQGKPVYTTPKPISDPLHYVALYRQAAEHAKAAGFDGVELHSANGYLPNQFLESHSNQRTDTYGGSVQNRCRFSLEAVQALIEGFGDAKCVGIKLSPTGGYNDMGEKTTAEAVQLFSHLIKQLDQMGIGYIQLVRYLKALDSNGRGLKELDVIQTFAPLVQNALVFVNGGFTAEEAETVVQSKVADAVVFGIPFIANPDFPDRVKGNQKLAMPDFSKLYCMHHPDGSLMERQVGYVSYPKAS